MLRRRAAWDDVDDDDDGGGADSPSFGGGPWRSSAEGLAIAPAAGRRRPATTSRWGNVIEMIVGVKINPQQPSPCERSSQQRGSWDAKRCSNDTRRTHRSRSGEVTIMGRGATSILGRAHTPHWRIFTIWKRGR